MMEKFNIVDQLIGNKTIIDNKVTTHGISDEALNRFQEFFKKQTLDQYKGKKVYVVMLFENEYHLGISDNSNKWINTFNRYFTDGGKALEYYANTPCPASQIIDADNIKELLVEMQKMINNFNNQDFLNQLYEYM